MKEAAPLTRINKYLAERRICARREADLLIRAGAVFVNGMRAKLGQRVSDLDKITIGPQKNGEKIYLAYHKPRGMITHSPQRGEKEIPRKFKITGKSVRLYSVGRLDKDSSGLIILTNDGRLTERMLNPRYAHEKTYTVTVDKPLEKNHLCRLSQGVVIEGYRTKPARTKTLGKSEFEITLTEGKKHQIRRMCAALGYAARSIKRTMVGVVDLGAIMPGSYRIIAGAHKQRLLKSLGL